MFCICSSAGDDIFLPFTTHSSVFGDKSLIEATKGSRNKVSDEQKAVPLKNNIHLNT
jgi:hypothetical protein